MREYEDFFFEWIFGWDFLGILFRLMIFLVVVFY